VAPDELVIAAAALEIAASLAVITALAFEKKV
jgi:hypothetical protein